MDYVTEATGYSENMDDVRFNMCLKLAQETLIDVLGAEFTDEIAGQYNAIVSSDTMTVDNETLYEDYIKDFLAWQTYHNHLSFSQSRSTPSGERAFKDENSDLLEDIKLSSLEANVARWTNHYRNKMITFLDLAQSRDSTKYPKYVKCSRDTFSWGISSISRNSDRDNVISINKAIQNNG